MYSPGQIVAALSNAGIKVTLTKHAMMGHTLSYSAPIPGPLAKLAHENRELLITYLSGADKVCPCGCGSAGTVKLTKRGRWTDANGMPAIYMGEHYVCAHYFATMKDAFRSWRAEKVYT